MDNCFDGDGCDSRRAAFQGQTCFSAGTQCTYHETIACGGGGFGCGSSTADETTSCTCAATGVGLTHWACASVSDCSSDGFDAHPPDGFAPPDTGPYPDVSVAESDIVIGSLAGLPHGVAVLGGNVFVIVDDRIVMFTPAPIGDGGWMAIDVALDLDGSLGLTAYGDSIYWSRLIATDGGPSAAIMRMRVQPQIGNPEIVAPSAVPPIEGIAVDATGVRWLDTMSGLVIADGDGGSKLVMAAPIASTGTFSLLARSGASTHFLASDQLVSLADDGGMSSSTVSGGVAVAVTNGGVWAARAVDGGVEIGATLDGGFSSIGSMLGLRSMVGRDDALYVADPDKNEIRKIPVGGSSVVLASPGGKPNDLAIDGSYVYYTTVLPKGGALHRVPR